MRALMLSVAGTGLLLWFAGALALWIGALHGLRKGQPIIPPEPRWQFPGWLPEIFIACGTYIVIGFALAKLLLPAGGVVNPGPVVLIQPGLPSDGAPVAESETADAKIAAPRERVKSAPDVARLIPLIAINSMATLAAVAAALLWTRLMGYSAAEFGIRIVPRHLWIGVKGAVMFLPPVMILQGLLTQLIKYEHPVLDVLGQAQSFQVLLAISIGAVLVAPLTEEFFFRGLIQGWLERLAGVGVPHPGATSDLRAGSDVLASDVLASEVPMTEDALPNPYTSFPLQRGLAPSLHGGGPMLAAPELISAEAIPSSPISGDPARSWLGRPVWPMVLSSLAFALVHAGQGPAPVSLFFLALGLGYLYRQTGSIWPGVVVHMSLNGLTTVAMLSST